MKYIVTKTLGVVAIFAAVSMGATVHAETVNTRIATEHLSRLFDRFYRVDPSRQKASDGAGLRLPITKSIIEAHQGKIHVFSSNRLTRFEITFPAF